MDKLAMAMEIAECEDACERCICKTDEECATSHCLDKIIEWLIQQEEQQK